MNIVHNQYSRCRRHRYRLRLQMGGSVVKATVVEVGWRW